MKQSVHEQASWLTQWSMTSWLHESASYDRSSVEPRMRHAWRKSTHCQRQLPRRRSKLIFSDNNEHCLSSAVASRLISLGAAFRDTLTVVVSEKWLCHSGHVNRFCYLLTARRRCVSVILAPTTNVIILTLLTCSSLKLMVVMHKKKTASAFKTFFIFKLPTIPKLQVKSSDSYESQHADRLCLRVTGLHCL